MPRPQLILTYFLENKHEISRIQSTIEESPTMMNQSSMPEG